MRRILLLGCVSEKNDQPMPAKALYCSPLWQLRRTHADLAGDPWAILSALHGLRSW